MIIPGMFLRGLGHFFSVTLMAIIAVGGLVAMPTELDSALDEQAIAQHPDDLSMAKLTVDLVKTLGTCMDFDIPSPVRIERLELPAAEVPAGPRRPPLAVILTIPRPPTV